MSSNIMDLVFKNLVDFLGDVGDRCLRVHPLGDVFDMAIFKEGDSLVFKCCDDGSDGYNGCEIGVIDELDWHTMVNGAVSQWGVLILC